MKRMVQAIVVMLFLSGILFSSCKKNQQNREDWIYEVISGRWATQASGTGTLWLIGGEDYHLYTYTDPSPVEDSLADAGEFWVNVPASRITFLNTITMKDTSYAFRLSPDYDTLWLDNDLYIRQPDE